MGKGLKDYMRDFGGGFGVVLETGVGKFSRLMVPTGTKTSVVMPVRVGWLTKRTKRLSFTASVIFFSHALLFIKYVLGQPGHPKQCTPVHEYKLTDSPKFVLLSVNPTN